MSTNDNEVPNKKQGTGRGTGYPHLITLPTGEHITTVSRTQCCAVLNTLCRIKAGVFDRTYVAQEVVATFVTMNMALPDGHLKGTRIQQFPAERAMLEHVLSLSRQ
jgi:hypothetical protein